MLAELFLFEDYGLAYGGGSLDRSWLRGLDSCSGRLGASLAPSLSDFRFLIVVIVTAAISDLVCVLLSLCFAEVLILLFVDFLGTLLSSLGHLLSHDLRKGVASTGRVKPFLSGGLGLAARAALL